MYRKKRVDSSNISDYEDLFPKSYGAMISSGRLSAGLILDPCTEPEQVLLVYVVTVRSGWMELIWLDVPDRSREDVLYADLFRTMITKECLLREEPLTGVFAEFYMDMRFKADRIRNVMLMAGMESSITKGNVYEFSLSEVGERETLKIASEKLKCISLSEADGNMFDKLDVMLQDDPRPSPLPMFVNWDTYLSEDSLICLRGDEPCGILLFSERMGTLIMDCASVADKVAFACLLGTAYARLLEKYGEDQKILVPVVVDRTAAIVERMVPKAQRADVVEAVMWL